MARIGPPPPHGARAGGRADARSLPHTEAMPSSRVWFNTRLPQLLYLAHLLMYIQGGITVLFTGFRLPGSGLASLSGLLVLVYWLMDGPFKVAAAFGIANLRRWGYMLGVASAVSPLLYRVLFAVGEMRIGALADNPITLLFEIALLGLLLHGQSRSYARQWSS